ncbi:hypothetical protein Tco_0298556 [Tanacetum coccineum]
MATLEFCDTHNMVAYLEKPEGSAEFHQIIDFLTAIHYALTKNPTIYASFVKQFWTTATTSTNVTGEIELTASIDGQAKTIIEASLRRHLKLEDNGGITSLPNTQIFDQLALMGSSTSLLPFIETTPTAEEPALMPHESPLQSVHSLGHDEGSVSLNELMDLVTQLTNKVGGLENELKNPKKVYGTAITKLAKRVKKLEIQVKTGKASRRTKIVLSKDEAVEEDSSKQGRSLIEELDMDADISLVPLHAEIQEKISDETEVLLKEEEATEIVQDQGSGEKGEQEVSTTDTALNTVNVPISTASETPQVSTAAGSLVYIRRSEKKKKDKGKAILIEDESVRKKSKKQEQEERLEEYDKAGKKEAVTEVDTAHVIDWNDPSVIRYHALQNRPRSVAEVRKNMMVYLKNLGGFKIKDFKGISLWGQIWILKRYGVKFIHLCLWILKKKFQGSKSKQIKKPKTDELSRNSESNVIMSSKKKE